MRPLMLFLAAILPNASLPGSLLEAESFRVRPVADGVLPSGGTRLAAEGILLSRLSGLNIVNSGVETVAILETKPPLDGCGFKRLMGQDF